MAVNWNFGETILSVLQKERDRKQEQEKFLQTEAFRERQFDLLNTYKQQNAMLNQEKLAETQRHNLEMEGKKTGKSDVVTVVEGDNWNKNFKIPPGEYPVSVFDNALSIMNPKPEKPDKPSVTEIEGEKKRKETELRDQEVYDAIMSSPRVSKEGLIKRGQAGEDYLYGGGYIYRTPGGNEELIPTDEELENLAKIKAPKAPNKWKKKNNDPLGIR